MKSLFKLSPIFLLAGIVMAGNDILVAAPIAVSYAVIVCMISEKCKLQDVLESAINNAKSGVLVWFIMMFACVVAQCFMATGVGATIIQMALSLGVTGRSVAMVAFLVTCILSVSTGTSWGTFAACIPIFIWLSHIVGGNPALVLCAAAGGSAFGDNIGLISDTTIFSCGVQDVEVVDRFRHQGVWSLICVALSAIGFYIAGLVMGLPTDVGNASDAMAEVPPSAWEALEEQRPAAIDLLNQVTAEQMPPYMVIPVVIVVGLAIFHIPTMACLIAGIVSSIILGIIAGTIISFEQVATLMTDGFVDAGSWVILMMMWVMAFGGIMVKMNAFVPIANFFVKISRRVSHLMTLNAILVVIGNMLLSEEVANMATTGPVIKQITEENVKGSPEDMYKLRLRNATFCDALGVLGAELIPWHVCSLFYVGLACSVYPIMKFTGIDLIRYNFMAWISIVSLILLTFTRFDRFVPFLRTPSEPDVVLEKKG